MSFLLFLDDFELIFRGTEVPNYVKYSMANVWFTRMTACAWIRTPDIEENQIMTIISMVTTNGNDKEVIREQIDGQGGFYFSFGGHR